MPEIRVLTQNDGSAFISLRAESLEQVPQAFMDDHASYLALPAKEKLRRFSETIASPDQFIVGAFDEAENLVGIAGFYREQPEKLRHRGNIWGFYVTTRAQRLGLGRLMLTSLIERACKLDGLEQIHLSVMTTQESARKLYESSGFKAYGREPNALKIGDNYFDDDLMVLFLPR